MRLFASLLIMTLAVTTASSAKVADFFVDSTLADSLYVKASLYEQDGELEEASRLLEVVLESKTDEHIYLKLAEIYNLLKDRDMVRYTLERGVRKLDESHVLLGTLADFYRSDPETAELSFELYRKAYKLSGDPMYAEGEAIAHAVLKDYNSAINIYTELIEKYPDISDYYVQRAKLYERLGLDQESIDDFVKAADIDGNFVAAAKLSDYFLKQGENNKAVEYLKMVLKNNPDMTIAKFRLAELLRKTGDVAEAEKFYTDILDNLNETEKVYVLKQLASINYNRNDLHRAEEYFVRAYEIDQNIQTAYSLALLAESSGDFAAAKEWYRKILEQRSDFVEAKKRLALIYLREGDAEKALSVIEGVENQYADVNYYRIKAQILIDKKDFKSAIDLLSKTIKENPAEVRLYMDLAVAYEKNGSSENAEKTIREGMRYFPDDPSLLNFLGYIYAEKGVNLKEAKDMIERALRQKPDEAAYLDSMAWVLYQMGRYKEALPYQKKALKGAPEEQEIRDHMEAILKKLGIRKTLDDILKED